MFCVDEATAESIRRAYLEDGEFSAMVELRRHFPGIVANRPYSAHVRLMFCVDEATAESIRRAYLEDGEFSAMVELRRHFPGIVDNENTRRCARAIAGWQPLPPLPVKPKRKCRTRSSTR